MVVAAGPLAAAVVLEAPKVKAQVHVGFDRHEQSVSSFVIGGDSFIHPVVRWYGIPPRSVGSTAAR